MATVSEVDVTLGALVARLEALGPEVRARYLHQRSVSLTVSDLDVVYAAQLEPNGLRDLHREPAPRAQVRLTVHSDDLVALAEGTLGIGLALATGRLRVEAGVMDLLKLRALL